MFDCDSIGEEFASATGNLEYMFGVGELKYVDESVVEGLLDGV